MSGKHDPRSGPNSMPLHYERPLHIERRRSPSPGPSGYGYYGRYPPSHLLPPMHDNLSAYLPSIWPPGPEIGPDRPFFLEEQVVERFPPPRDMPSTPWNSVQAWAPLIAEPMGWSNRRQRNPSFESPPAGGRRETLAGRMFEPSDSWKQSHGEPGSPNAGSTPGQSPGARWRSRTPSGPIDNGFSPSRNRFAHENNHYSPPSHYSPPRGDYVPPALLGPPPDLLGPPLDMIGPPPDLGPPGIPIPLGPPVDPYGPPDDLYSPSRARYSPIFYPPDEPFRPRSLSPRRYPYLEGDSYRPQYDNDEPGPWNRQHQQQSQPRFQQKHRRRGGRRRREQQANHNRGFNANAPRPGMWNGPPAEQGWKTPPGLPKWRRKDSGALWEPPFKKQRSDSPSLPPPSDENPRFSDTPDRPPEPLGPPPEPLEQPPEPSERPPSPPRGPPPDAPVEDSTLSKALLLSGTGVRSRSHTAEHDSLASTPHDDMRHSSFTPAAVPPPLVLPPHWERMERPQMKPFRVKPIANPSERPALQIKTDLEGNLRISEVQPQSLIIRGRSWGSNADYVPVDLEARVSSRASNERSSAWPSRLATPTDDSGTDRRGQEQSRVATPADESDMEMSPPPSASHAEPPMQQEETPTSSQPASDTEEADMDIEGSVPPTPRHETPFETPSLPPVAKTATRADSHLVQFEEEQVEQKLGIIPAEVQQPALSFTQTDIDAQEELDMLVDAGVLGAIPIRGDSTLPRLPSAESVTAVGDELPDVSARLPTILPDDPTREHDDVTAKMSVQYEEFVSDKLQVELQQTAVISAESLDRSDTTDTIVEGERPPLSPVQLSVESAEVKDPPATGDQQPDTAPSTAVVIPQEQSVPVEPEDISTPPPEPTHKPLSEALRLVVMTRLRHDWQTRDERVNPVLFANLSIVEPAPPPAQPPSPGPAAPSSEAMVKNVLGGERGRAPQAFFTRTQVSLQQRFAQRQAALSEKVKNLREEYTSLHERWMTHCAKLDEEVKATALEEAAATAGRTTRRSAALGDAVRSDLEMEQIIASLGNEELTDASHLGAKNAAVIPDMLSVSRCGADYVFDDTNHRVDDPAAFYDPGTGVDDWADDEKAIFLEKWVQYPKQFGIIAEFLPHKTPAQCVTYYYLHKHTTTDFRKILSEHTAGKRKRGKGRADKKKQNALLSDIHYHDVEMSRDSTPGAGPSRRRRAPLSSNAEPRRTMPPRRSTTAQQLEPSPVSTPTPDPEPEQKRRKRAVKPTARAVASMEQESREPTTEPPEPKASAKRGRKSKKVVKSAETVNSPPPEEEPPAVPETRFIDQTDFTSRRKTTPGGANWSEEDKDLFLKLLAQHGDDFKRISASMPNKTTVQVTQYYRYNALQLGLGRVAASAPKRSPTPDMPFLRDIWKESSIPGSGVLTPTTDFMTPRDMSMAPPDAPPGAIETRFRVNGRGSPSGRLHVQEVYTSSERGKLASDSAALGPSSSFQFRSTSFESMQGQFAPDAPAPASAPPRSYTPIQPRPTPPASEGRSSQPPPAPLTTTFPSNFAYSNLSPSHFANDQRPPPRATGRPVSPPHAASSATMTFDASMFQQAASGPPPALLRTTDDLVAYLEHRTRQTASQMDFP